ncbi:hypothetical protein LLH00_17415 [bacterium]|nr:hypothetical protein [bacterium]
MKIDNFLQRTDAKSLKDQAPVDKPREGAVKGAKDGSASGVLRVDTVTISEQARNLQRTQGENPALQSQEEKEVEVSQDKVQTARTALAGGLPLSDEVVEKTAEAILTSGALGDIIDSRRLAAGAGRSGLDSVAGPDEDRLQQIRQRIDSGYYNNSEVASGIADRMLEDMLA